MTYTFIVENEVIQMVLPDPAPLANMFYKFCQLLLIVLIGQKVCSIYGLSSCPVQWSCAKALPRKDSYD